MIRNVELLCRGANKSTTAIQTRDEGPRTK